MQWARVGILVLLLLPAALFLKSIVVMTVVRLIATALFLPALLIASGREMNITLGDYGAVLWRPSLAACSMAVAISVSNSLMSEGIARLLCDVMLGAAIFAMVSIACWRASGKPVAPEKDLIEAITRLISKLGGRHMLQ